MDKFRKYFLMGLCLPVSLCILSSCGDDEPKGDDEGKVPGIGATADHNPYQPTSGKKVSKITLVRDFTDGITNKVVYLFKYDDKSRIIEYTAQSINPDDDSVNSTETFNFTYDDTSVYLYQNQNLINTATIGENGYIAELSKGTSVIGEFEYNTSGQLTCAKSVGSSGRTTSWNPSYDGAGNMTYNDNNFYYTYDIVNGYSVDLNALISACYQMEWFFHSYQGVVWGLFDFYGKRSPAVVSKDVRGTYWTDSLFDFDGEMVETPFNGTLPSSLKIRRTGSGDAFEATYTIECY